MSRYSLRNRSSCAHESTASEEEFAKDSSALLAHKKANQRLESNLSPSILKKFQKMTTFSPHKPRSLKRSLTSRLSKTSKKNDGDMKNDIDTPMVDVIELYVTKKHSAAMASKVEASMCDSDMIPVELPERYNYQVWEDPTLEQNQGKEAQKQPDEFGTDDKENSWRPSAILHAFSPFKKNREERALKALSIASFPEYLQLKGQFFNELGKSFFKKKEKDPSRFKATKINLFRNIYQPSFPIFSSGLNAASKETAVMADVDPICQIPTPEVAKPGMPSLTVMRHSPIGQSKISAFRSFRKDEDKSKPKDDKTFNDTPFNTPRSEFMNRTVDFSSSETTQSVTKRNLRPRPTRPPTLFGFSSDFSEDDTCSGNTKRRK